MAYRKRREGEVVKVKGIVVPYTFWPNAYIRQGRIVTTNPWACMSAHINLNIKMDKQKKRAIAFLNQAEAFYQAAATPRLGAQPLLYYYSFLNLAKAFLVVSANLDLSHCLHGLSEPDDNIRKRLTITSQQVKAHGPGGAKVKVYRDLVRYIGFQPPSASIQIKLVDLLDQIVAIHPTVCHSLKKKVRFFPINTIAFEASKKEVWVTVTVKYDDLAVNKDAPTQIRENMTSFEEVGSGDIHHRCYQSKAIAYKKTPLDVLSKIVEVTKKDIWSVLRPGGYQFYVSAIASRDRLAQVASAYQTMFYFGSIARYRPDDFLKFVEGKHGWLIQEFINTQPLQFVFLVGGALIGAEMVVPEIVI